MSSYFLVLKTGAAEMRAFSHLSSDQKSPITPLFELTRGRKNHAKTIAKTSEEYNFRSIVEFVDAAVLPGQMGFLDVTRERSLSSERIKRLISPENGYEEWVQFVRERQTVNRNICPVIQVNPLPDETWENYLEKISAQFDNLALTSSAIAYRAFPHKDTEFDLDIQALRDRINSFTAAGNLFFVILDYEFIRPGTGELHSIDAAQVCGIVKGIVPSCRLVLTSTSFPKSVTDVGGADSGEFNIEEVFFHSYAARRLHNIAPVIYGDYGSINPIRNDVIANGWRPRIDYPFGGRRLFYFREKREKVVVSGVEEKTSYASHYRSVAKKIASDSRFANDPLSSAPGIWGSGQIIEAANGVVPSSSPSYWISVRMNVHILQQVRRLTLPDEQSAELSG